MVRFLYRLWCRIPPNALWLYAGSLVAGIFSYLYNIVMARPAFLGPTQFGALAALGSLLYLEGIVASTVTTVTANYTARFLGAGGEGNIRKFVRQVSLFVLSGSVVVGVGLFLAAQGITRLLHLPSSMSVFILVPLLVMTLLVSVLLGVLQGSKAFGTLSLVTVIGALLRFLIALPLVAQWHLGVNGALLANLGALLTAYGVSFMFLQRHWHRGQSLSRTEEPLSWREVWGYSGYVFVMLLGLTSLFSMDIILAQHYLAASQASFYASFSTLGRILYFATLPITMMMFPILTQRLVTSQPYRRMIFLTGGSITIISLCFVMLYVTLPVLVIRYTVGFIYTVEATELWFYAVFYAALSIATWLAHILLAQRRLSVVTLPVLCVAVQMFLTIRFHQSAHNIVLNSLVAALLLVISFSIVSVIPRAQKS